MAAAGLLIRLSSSRDRSEDSLTPQRQQPSSRASGMASGSRPMSSWGQRPPRRRARVQDAVRYTIAAGTRTLPARKASKISQKVQRQWHDADKEQGDECKGTVMKAISVHRSHRGSQAHAGSTAARALPAETIAADVRPTAALVSCSGAHRPPASAQLRTYIAVQRRPP
jgi:hypothetical protein